MDYEMLHAQPLPAKPAPVAKVMGDRGGATDHDDDDGSDKEDSWWKKSAPGK
jgi:hypothetical protein